MTNFNLNSVASGLGAIVPRSLALFTFILLAIASVSAQAEFFDNAFANAKRPLILGSGWVVTARVIINGGQNREFVSARGPVMLASDGTLGGELPMSINNSPAANNTLSIHIRKSDPSVVQVSRNIGGKPFLGRGPIIVSLPVKPNFNYILGPIKWYDGDREIQIFLESEYVKPKPAPPQPKAARYQIGGYMRVSNSSDGVGDNTVEIYGNLYLHQYRAGGKEVAGSPQLIFDLIPQDANNGFQLDFKKNIFIDAYEGDTLTLEGGFQDRDKGQGLTGDDPMFNGYSCMNKFGVYNLYRITLRDGSMLCKGDQDSESADIRIFAKKIKDL